MDEAAASFLLSHAGADVLQVAANIPGDLTTRLLTLRKRGVAPNVAALAVEVIAARGRAAKRGFRDAERLFLTEDALAQATSPALAAYRARYLAPFGTVADLCCGVGMDTVALAEAGATVVAVDTDPVRLIFARANAVVRGVAHRVTFRCEPAEAMGWRGADAAFFDPARRTEVGARVSRHADRYEPPLSFLETVRDEVRGGCAKLSPALPDDVLSELAASRIEFLSERRECKEACVWFGEAHGAAGAGDAMAAVSLPDALVFATEQPAPPDVEHYSEAFLLDPDPAVIRAGALETLCRLARAAPVSPGDAYLLAGDVPTGDAARWASAYRVRAVMPYRPEAVRAWLQARGYGRVVVKKRHFPKEPDAVAREVGASVRGAGGEITLVLVREAGAKFTAVLCEPA